MFHLLLFRYTYENMFRRFSRFIFKRSFNNDNLDGLKHSHWDITKKFTKLPKQVWTFYRMHYPISAYYTTISSYLLQTKTFFFVKNAVNTQNSFTVFTTLHAFLICNVYYYKGRLLFYKIEKTRNGYRA